MLRWLLLSDLFPLLLFIHLLLLSERSSSLILIGMIASRALSIVFHLFAETHPHLINLDYIGIASMSAAPSALCRTVACPHSDAYDAYLAAAFVILSAVFFHDLTAQRPGRAAMIKGLALSGMYPCLWAAYAGRDEAGMLCGAAGVLIVGFFVVEPRSHVAWHWAAAVAQWMMLAVGGYCC